MMVAVIRQLVRVFIFGLMDVIVLIVIEEIIAVVLVMDGLLMMMMVMMAGAVVVGMWVVIMTATAVKMAAIERITSANGMVWIRIRVRMVDSSEAISERMLVLVAGAGAIETARRELFVSLSGSYRSGWLHISSGFGW